MTWRVARSLDTLLSQINAAYPLRSKVSDGALGDAAHATRNSDHNPWLKDGDMGVVTARDFTHDPDHGFDAYKFADLLKANADPRIKYVISNRRIWTPIISNTWRVYNGVNAHAKHTHVSVRSDKAHYDDASPWKIATWYPRASTNNPQVLNKPHLEQNANSATKSNEKLSVLQSKSSNDGSRSPVVIPHQPEEKDGIRKRTDPLPISTSPSVRELQPATGKPDVSHNGGSNEVPPGQIGKEGGGGGQNTLPTPSNRPTEATREHGVSMALPPDYSRPKPAVAFLESLGWKRHQAAAIVGQGIWESGGKDHINSTALGDNGTAHGGWQWRGDRYVGRNGLLGFAYGLKTSSAQPETQLRFVHWELNNTEKRVGSLLKAATNVEEATKAFICYLRPAKAKNPEVAIWDDPAGGHGYANRLKLAQNLL